MKKQIMFVFMVAAFVLGAYQLHAAAPSTAVQHTPGEINYQGLLVKTDGEPVADGTYALEVRLYRGATGGTPIWGGRYSTFAKSGYFNIILGGSSGVTVSGTQPTYAHSQLWRALWPDSDIPANQKNLLFLGVTPVSQPATGQLNLNVEISPRQNLLAAPYAFRAQTAEYANQSFGDFKVKGAFEAGYGDDSSDVAFKTYRNLYKGQIAQFIDIGGGVLSKIKLQGSTADINTSALSVTAATQSFKSGAGGITLDSDTGDVNIKGKDATINMDGNVSVSGAGANGTTIGSVSKPLQLQGNEIKGHGDLSWRKKSSSTSFEKPFIVRKFTIDLGSNQSNGQIDTQFKFQDYSAMVVGWQAPSGITIHRLEASHLAGTTSWVLNVVRAPATQSAQISVTVLFINKYLVDDPR